MRNLSKKVAAVNWKLLVGVFILGIALVVGGAIWRQHQRSATIVDARADGVKAFEDGDWGRAASRLSTYTKAVADDWEAWRMYGDALLRLRPFAQSHLHEAVTAYRQLFQHDPTDDVVFSRLAKLLQATGNVEDLSRLAEKRLQAVPADGYALLTKARVAMRREEYAEARSLLESVVNDQKLTTTVRAEACMVMVALLETETASAGDRREWLVRALSISPDSGLVRASLASLMMAAGETGAVSVDQLSAARQELEVAEKLATEDVRTFLAVCGDWVGLGEAYSLIGEADEAATCFARAKALLGRVQSLSDDAILEQYVDHADWLVELGRSAARYALVAGDIEAGKAVLSEVEKQLSDRSELVSVLPLMVHVALQEGDHDKAKTLCDTYETMTKERGARPDQEENLAYLRALLAMAEEQPYAAKAFLEPMASREGGARRVQSLMGQIYVRLGQPDRAISAIGDFGDGLQSLSDIKVVAMARAAMGQWGDVNDLLSDLVNTPAADADVRLLWLNARLHLADSPEEIAALSEEAEHLKEANPKRADIRALIAAIAEKQGDVEQAERVLRRAVDECDPVLPAVIQMASFLAGQDRHADAIAFMRQMCDKFPDKSEPWVNLSRFLVEVGDIEAAREALVAAKEKVDEQEKDAIIRQTALFDLNHGSDEDKEAAVASLTSLITESPRDLESRVILLENAAMLIAPALVEELIEGVKAIEGEGGVVWRTYRARALLSSGDWRHYASVGQEIVSLLNYCIDNRPLWAVPPLFLGQYYESVGRAGDAEVVYTQAFERTGAMLIAEKLLDLLERSRRTADAFLFSQKLGERLSADRRSEIAEKAGKADIAIGLLEDLLPGAKGDEKYDLQVRLARQYFIKDGEPSRALEILDELDKESPKNVASHRLRVAILRMAGETDQALAFLDERLAIVPTGELLRMRASLHEDLKQFEKAKSDYTTLVEVDPSELSYAMLGDFYANHDRLDTAIEIYDAASKKYPNSQAMKKGLAKSLMLRNGQGDAARVRDLLNSVGDRVYHDTDFLVLWIAGQLREDAEENRQQVRQVIKDISPDLVGLPSTFLQLAQIAASFNELESSAVVIKRAVSLYPGDVGLHLYEAELLLRAGKLTESRRLAEAVLASSPTNPVAWRTIVQIDAANADVTRLQRDAEQIAQLIVNDPANSTLHVLLANVHMSAGDIDKAIELLTGFCESPAGSENAATMATLVEMAVRQHQVDPESDGLVIAEDWLKRAETISPTDPEVVQAKITFLAASGDYDALALLAEDVLGETSVSVDFAVGIAGILQGQQAYVDKAADICLRVTQKNPEHTAAWYLLANCRYAAGDSNGAVEAYRETLTLNPYHADAMNNLAWVLGIGLGQLDEGVEIGRKAVTLSPSKPDSWDTLATLLEKKGDSDGARDAFHKAAEQALANIRKAKSRRTDNAEMIAKNEVLRARALYQFVKLSIATDDDVGVSATLREIKRIDDQRGCFSDAERAEINSMLKRVEGES